MAKHQLCNLLEMCPSNLADELTCSLMDRIKGKKVNWKKYESAKDTRSAVLGLSILGFLLSMKHI